MKRWLSILINLSSFLIGVLVILIFSFIQKDDPIIATFQTMFLFISAALIFTDFNFLILSYLRGKNSGKIIGVLMAVLSDVAAFIFSFCIQGLYPDIKDYHFMLLAFLPTSFMIICVGYVYYLLFGHLIASSLQAFSNLIVFGVSYILSIPFAALAKYSSFLFDWLPLIILVITIFIVCLTIYKSYWRWFDSLPKSEQDRIYREIEEKKERERIRREEAEERQRERWGEINELKTKEWEKYKDSLERRWYGLKDDEPLHPVDKDGVEYEYVGYRTVKDPRTGETYGLARDEHGRPYINKDD